MHFLTCIIEFNINYAINVIITTYFLSRPPPIYIGIGFFKVVLSLGKKKSINHKPYTINPPKAIGFYYSNSSVKQSIQATATTVDEIEQLTGIDFFYTLPDSIETVVEGRFNLEDWK